MVDFNTISRGINVAEQLATRAQKLEVATGVISKLETGAALANGLDKVMKLQTATPMMNDKVFASPVSVRQNADFSGATLTLKKPGSNETFTVQTLKAVSAEQTTLVIPAAVVASATSSVVANSAAKVIVSVKSKAVNGSEGTTVAVAKEVVNIAIAKLGITEPAVAEAFELKLSEVASGVTISKEMAESLGTTNVDATMSKLVNQAIEKMQVAEDINADKAAALKA